MRRKAVKIPAHILLLFLLAAPFVFGQNDYRGGPVKATTHVYPDGSTSTTVTDPDKRTSEEVVRDAGGKMIRRTVHPLNDQDFARGAIHYNAKNEVTYKEIYVFDASGRIIESKLFTKDNQPKGKLVFIYEGNAKARIEDYDEYGRLITPANPQQSASKKKPGK